jgi:hypothetical protein
MRSDVDFGLGRDDKEELGSVKKEMKFGALRQGEQEVKLHHDARGSQNP